MKNYKNITGFFDERYKPFKALVIHASTARDNPKYVESYDLDENGYPINAHPLTVKESAMLRKALAAGDQTERNSYLTSQGLMPENVLHVGHAKGHVVWHTPPQRRTLRFTNQTGLLNGEANVPRMVWKATKSSLSVWALSGKRSARPKIDDPLCHAPFFNIYENGSVCLGTVNAFEDRNGSLEDFTRYWEESFWNSSFSHLNIRESPVKGNIIQLWEGLIGTDEPFPLKSLLTNGRNLGKII